MENKPGAQGTVATDYVAKSRPDGYTLLAAMDTTLVMNPATKTSLLYDPFKDFAAVSLGAKNTSLLTVRADDGHGGRVREAVVAHGSGGFALGGLPADGWRRTRSLPDR